MSDIKLLDWDTTSWSLSIPLLSEPERNGALYFCKIRDPFRNSDAKHLQLILMHLCLFVIWVHLLNCVGIQIALPLILNSNPHTTFNSSIYIFWSRHFVQMAGHLPRTARQGSFLSVCKNLRRMAQTQRECTYTSVCWNTKGKYFLSSSLDYATSEYLCLWECAKSGSHTIGALSDKIVFCSGNVWYLFHIDRHKKMALSRCSNYNAEGENSLSLQQTTEI